MELGNTIYRLRTQRDMSQGDLAEALEVSRQSVSKWENNSAVPELEKLIRMAQVFGITLDELVSGEAQEPVSEPSAPPQPEWTPTPSAPVKTDLTPMQIIGIIFMAFGGLCLIVFTVVGIFVGRWLLGLAIALPCLLCGIIFLLCKKNVGLLCAWAVYLFGWLLINIFLMR